MRRNFPFLVFCAYGMVQSANAAQAIPNTLVTLSSPVVRVSDLFSNAGPEAEHVLGAAPAPGERIVVQESQLAAIAAAYQVPWTPDGSDPEVVLASPGSALPPSAIENAIANAVASSGGPADAAITLPDFTPVMVPPGASPAISVTRMAYDPGTGNFSASLVIDAAGMAPQNVDLSGLAQAVTSANLSAPVVVRKGAFLVLNLSAPGMMLTAQGVALDSGGAGSVISVLNPASHAVVQAVVTGPDAASIAPGSAPISAPQSGGGYGGYTSYAQAHGGGYSSLGMGQ